MGCAHRRAPRAAPAIAACQTRKRHLRQSLLVRSDAASHPLFHGLGSRRVVPGRHGLRCRFERIVVLSLYQPHSETGSDHDGARPLRNRAVGSNQPDQDFHSFLVRPRPRCCPSVRTMTRSGTRLQPSCRLQPCSHVRATPAEQAHVTPRSIRAVSRRRRIAATTPDDGARRRAHKHT